MNSSRNAGDLILVIDMQNVYLPGQPWACPRMPEATENICRILEAAPQVLFTRFLAPENPVGTWRNYNEANQKVNEDAWMNALAEPFYVDEANGTVTMRPDRAENAAGQDAAASAATDGGAACGSGASQCTTYPLYSKSTYSALTVPEVREAALHCGRLVLTGVVADCCVLWTAMEAIDLGIPVVYITDAVAGIDDESEAAADRVVRGLSPAQTTLLTTQEYLQSNIYGQ